MCLIVEQPAGHRMTDAQVRDVYEHNPHGFGVLHVVDGKLVVRKSLPRDAAECVALYDEHAAGRACVVHWRWATHGSVDLANAHPHVLSSSLAFVHNGVIAGYGNPLRHESDTAEFARVLLGPLLQGDPLKLVDDRARRVIDGLTQRSVLTFVGVVDGQPLVVRVDNGRGGCEVNGAWYSNRYAWTYDVHVPRAPRYSRHRAGCDDWRCLGGEGCASWSVPRAAQRTPAQSTIAAPSVSVTGVTLLRAPTPVKRSDVHPCNPFARARPRHTLADVAHWFD